MYAANEKLQSEIEERKKVEKELLLKAQLLDRASDSIIVHGFSVVLCQGYGHRDHGRRYR